MFDYKFIFPPPAQLDIRRQQLNAAGFQAWATPIILLFAIYFTRISLRLLYPAPWDITTLKYTKEPTPTQQPLALITLIRRAKWILSTPSHPEFGPVYIPLLATLYTSYLLYLSFAHTGNDYMHLTKQLGHVAVSQLPWQYLLAIKSPYSPITLATGLTHERLNAFHRLFGRIVHGLIAMHAVLYLNFFVQLGVLGKRLGDWDVRLGVLGFAMVNFVGVLSLPTVRRRAYYKVFWRSHVVLTGLLVVVLMLHQGWTRWYLAQAGVIFVGNVVLRRGKSVEGLVRVESIEGRGLMKVVVRPTTQKTIPWGEWVPGEHVYLRPEAGLMGPRNPFTIVDVLKKDAGVKEVVLVVRQLGGPGTQVLDAGTKQDSNVNGELVEAPSKPMLLEGPYGEASQYLPEMLRQGRDGRPILLVAGGVGATYIIPIYSALLKARYGTEGIKMLWFVKSEADARWGIDMLVKDIAFRKSVDIYVTGPDEASQTKKLANGVVDMGGVRVIHAGKRPDLSGIAEDVMAPKAELGEGSVREKSKRNLGQVKKSYERVTVFVCGPSGLSRALRREVGKHVLGYGREVRWFEEQFGFGG